jgi:hypothetical protein
MMSHMSPFDIQNVLDDFAQSEHDLQIELQQVFGELSALADSMSAALQTPVARSEDGDAGAAKLGQRLLTAFQEQSSQWQSVMQDTIGERLNDLRAELQSSATPAPDPDELQHAKLAQAKLAAELQLVRARAAELYRVNQTQQQLLEQSRALDAELARLRASVDACSRLVTSQQPAPDGPQDHVLGDALETLEQARDWTETAASLT